MKRCPGPVSRRWVLQAGVLGLGGLSLGEFLRLRAQAQPARSSPPDTAFILLWLPGGPPHVDMYDIKPQAPEEYRSPFRPIQTKVPGLQVCELMPRHAQVADRLVVIRSIAHKFSDHGGGHKRFLTGRIPRQPVGFVNDAPAVGSIVAKCREHVRLGVPNYVAGTPRGNVDTFSFGAAYLGHAYTPFIFHGDPSRPDFQIRNLAIDPATARRLQDRITLLKSFDRLRRDVDASGMMEAMDQFHRQALEMLLSSRTREAFDLSKEPREVRQRYGMHAWGQRALLARRLVEAGCSFVTMVLENPYQSGIPWIKQGVYNWDSHAVNCHIFDDLRVRLPLYDQVVTALVEDIYQRGLDKRVMVVVTGEFGRTPRINPQVGTRTGVRQPGRDHWPWAMSVVVFGGGVRTGQVIGATDSKGAYPIQRALTPNDLWATVYRHLGIDPQQTFPDFAGRPRPILPFGEPIRELL